MTFENMTRRKLLTMVAGISILSLLPFRDARRLSGVLEPGVYRDVEFTRPIILQKGVHIRRCRFTPTPGAPWMVYVPAGVRGWSIHNCLFSGVGSCGYAIYVEDASSLL